jgi:pimeloyl-ACP methyl ester carboxylesterase
LIDDAARRHGVRLLAVTRPGYGASTATVHGLASVGRQVVALADRHGIDRFATIGSSGGGPFALATAAVAPGRVESVVVAAGVAPGLAERSPDDEGFVLLAAGDVDKAQAQMTAEVAEMIAGMRDLSDEEFRERMASQTPPGEHFFDDKPTERATFVADFRRALAKPDGFVRDNMSWGGPWDIDPAGISVPVTLLYGESDQMMPAENGHLLAGLIPHADLTVLPGAGHGDTTFGSADLVMGLIAGGSPAAPRAQRST